MNFRYNEPMTKIYKKTWPRYFNLVKSNRKSFDFRLANFACQAGDILVLQEWDPETKQYTGREIEKEVTFVTSMSELEVWPQEQAEKYGYYLMSLAEPPTELHFDSQQKSVKEFVAYGLRRCDDYSAHGDVLQAVARDIRDRYETLTPPLHPMLQTANDILRDIEYEAYHDNRESDKELCSQLHTLLRDYNAGRWHPTVWALMANYREGQKGYSLLIERHHDSLRCDIPHAALNDIIQRIVEEVDTTQTDEQFLKNIAYMFTRERRCSCFAECQCERVYA